MSLDLEDTPPPPYTESQAQSFPLGQSQPQSSNRQPDLLSSFPDVKLTIQTADGTRPVTARLHIFNDPGVLPEHQEMHIKLEGSTSKAYYVNFPSRSRTTATMHVHRGCQTGPIVGQAPFLAKESHIEIGFSDGESVRIEDVNPNTRRVAVRLLVDGVPQTFYWASTQNYEHKYKGGGPVGDVELVDEAGRVYGVFLNEWCASGSKDKTRVGQLNMLEPIIEDRLVDQWVVTLLALIERYVIVSSVKSGKIAEVAAGAAAATVAFCVVA
jgi:hypothetical protein